MPEGPQVARYARLQAALLAGRVIRADSPNGRAAQAAAAIDGLRLRAVEAIGKHLLYDFGEGRYLHVHLGRFGNFHEGPMPLPEPRGVLRFRLYTPEHWFELRGAIAIEPFDAAQRGLLAERIGPNPLDPAADAKAAYAKISRSRSPIGALLMDQSIVAGVGNIYRSEVLFLRRVHPRAPGTSLGRTTWRALWRDLARLMADGAKNGRIVTTAVKDRRKRTGAARRDDRFYVYHRAGLPCRRCGAAILVGTIANRNVYWCPAEQREAEGRSGSAAGKAYSSYEASTVKRRPAPRGPGSAPS
jgi:endonuclease-8